MIVENVAFSYWRSIKRGNREFETLKKNIQEQVRWIAREEVSQGLLPEEAYKEYIGEAFEPNEEE